MKGSFIISLDYELLWGVIEKPTAQEYAKSNVSNVPAVIEGMLQLFDKYEVEATFATVGLVMLNNREEVSRIVPSLLPTYKNEALSPYNGCLQNVNENNCSYFFSPHSISLLRDKSNIEIGTHTFCHYYCLAEGQTVEQFEEDLKSAIKVADINGIKMRSIVFPRNQVSKPYLSICSKYGIECYRGNALRFFGAKNRVQRVGNKIGRLLDSYINVGARTSYPIADIDLDESPVNIRASRFFRPYNGSVSFLEPLRIKRIKKEIEYAAKHNEVYHLWWHPHNFGKDIERNIANLESVLSYFAICRDKYGMQSYTMSGMLDALKKAK